MDAIATHHRRAEQIVPWIGTLLAVGVFLMIRLRFVQIGGFPQLSAR
jgi:hypothetical protein